MNLVFEQIVPDNLIRIVFSAVIALVVVWRSIPVIRVICIERNLSDSPIKRSSHTSPIPTFGGVGIFAGTIIGYMMWNFNDEGYLMHKVFACTTILFFLGIKDDIYGLSATKKLYTQVIAACLIVVGSDLRISSFFGIFGVYELQYLISVLFTIFLIVALINAFNLIDGIDGLAGSVSMIASAGFALWFMLNGYWSLACLGVCLAASLLGFLRYNFSKTSKIFMGDTGSLVAGFLVSVLAIKFIAVNVTNADPSSVYKNAPNIALALLSIPVFDTLRVFAVRIIRKKSPFNPDRVHLHHVLVDIGLTHQVVTLIMSAFTIVFTLLTYYLRLYFTNTQISMGILAVFVAYLFFGMWFEAARYQHKKSWLRNNKNNIASAIGFANSEVKSISKKNKVGE